MPARALLAMFLLGAAAFGGITGCARPCACARAASLPTATVAVSCAQPPRGADRNAEIERRVALYRCEVRAQAAARGEAVPALADDLSPPPADAVDACGPPTTRPRAECYLRTHRGPASSERDRRLLIVAYWQVGDQEHAREIARTYAALHPTSPFLRQIELITSR